MIHMDLEIYSAENVRQVGAWRQAMDPSTEILICAYSYDEQVNIRSWELGDPPPEKLNARIRAGEPIAAHNAEYEFAMLSAGPGERAGFAVPQVEQMVDTATQAAICGLPRSLDGATQALNLPFTKQKDGMRLIKLFCQPRAATKNNPLQRIMPWDAPIDWSQFLRYCKGDVAAERALCYALPALTRAELRAWQLTTRINRRGLPIDLPTAQKAYKTVQHQERYLRRRCQRLTGGIAPTRVAALTEWLGLPNLQKATVQAVLDDSEALDATKREVLELRLQAGRAATKKLASMIRLADLTGRAHGTLLHYGARTGRWSGRLVQPQNFIRGDPAAQDAILDAVEVLDLFEDQPLHRIAESMRGLIRATPGHQLIVADYSAIEARVLAWLAGQADVLALYHQGVDTYVEMAAHMFQKSLAEVTGWERRIGKNTVLGCGYGMGPDRYLSQAHQQGATDVTPGMARRAVEAYRQRYDRVVALWYNIEKAARRAVETGQPVRCRHLTFDVAGDFLRMQLPSGRYLYYYHPDTRTDELDRVSVVYDYTLGSKLVERKLWGGLLVENAVQAIARDLMLYGMHQAERGGYPIVMTVHDELIAELDEKRLSGPWLDAQGEMTPALREYCELLCRLPRWAEGIPLTAAGFVCTRYRKG